MVIPMKIRKRCNTKNRGQMSELNKKKRVEQFRLGNSYTKQRVCSSKVNECSEADLKFSQKQEAKMQQCRNSNRAKRIKPVTITEDLKDYTVKQCQHLYRSKFLETTEPEVIQPVYNTRGSKFTRKI